MDDYVVYNTLYDSLGKNFDASDMVNAMDHGLNEL